VIAVLAAVADGMNDASGKLCGSLPNLSDDAASSRCAVIYASPIVMMLPM